MIDALEPCPDCGSDKHKSCIPHKRSCNRHADCDKAEEELLARNPGKTKKDISFSFHCHDDECEECFGA